jgi:hypothetical protein
MKVSSHRRVGDAIAGANGSDVRVTSVTGGGEDSDLGLAVYGTGIVAGAVVVGFAGIGNIHFTLGGPCAPTCHTLAASTPIPDFRVGDDSATAAADGEAVVDIGVMLDLAPTFVPGSQACSAEEPEGFHIVGIHRSPDAIVTPAYGVMPATDRVLGQIHFPNATGDDFAAYIVQKLPGAAGDIIPTDHYDVVFPSLPVAVATCPQDPDGIGPLTTTDYDAPGVGLSLTVLANTSSVATLPTGTGRPGTSQYRAIQDSAVGYATSVYLENTSGPAFAPAANFNRFCPYPVTAYTNFEGGNG